MLAEHVTTGDSLQEIVARLGVNDRCQLKGSVVEIEQAAIALRDLVAPRTESAPGPVVKREAPDGTVLKHNRYKGTCDCGRTVPEGQGKAVKSNGKWSIICRTCEGVSA